MVIAMEFQAVVLAAGKGSRMLEVTSGQPKCLLPVGPKPLIWYTLQKLQSAGILEVIVVLLEIQKAEIENAISKELECGSLQLKIDYVSILEDREDMGTAESLRLKEVYEKLKADVLVVSCDLIMDISLTGVINSFRRHDASIATMFFHSSGDPIQVPGPKSKHKPEKDLVGIDAQTNRLVFLASASDFESELSLPLGLFKKHSNIQMYSNLIDSHVYILKHWVIQYLKSEESFASLKGELVPYLVKKQLSKPPKQFDMPAGSIVNATENNEIFAFAKEDESEKLIRQISPYNDHWGDLKSTYHDDVIRCYAYIAPKGTVGVRINTLPAYWSINGKVQEIWSKVTGMQSMVKQSPKAEILTTQLEDKSIIWDGVKLSEKTSFKNSILATNTKVDNFSRAFNCIIMSNVVIKEKVALENCIVCDNVVIESGCKLKNCIVSNNHLVPEGSEHKSELLTEALMHF